MSEKDPIMEWFNHYKPIANPFTSDRSWIINDKAIMFETYGEELEFVRNQDYNHVWTWLEGDGCTFIGAGRSFVNRIGYFVTEVPWDDENLEIIAD